jgi:hypothetical protein
LGFSLHADSLIKVPELMPDEQKMVDIMLETVKKSGWSGMDETQFNVVITKGAFCRALCRPEYQKLWKTMDDRQLKRIDADCAIELQPLLAGNVTIPPKLGDSAFARYRELPFPLHVLRPAQVGHVSMEVKGEAFSHLNGEALNSLSPDQKAALRGPQLRALSPSKISGTRAFDAENIKLYPSATLRGASDELLAIIPPQALQALSLEQLREVGRDSKARLEPLRRIIASFDDERRELLQDRFAEIDSTPVDSGSVPSSKTQLSDAAVMALWISAIALLAIVLIIGAIFVATRMGYLSLGPRAHHAGGIGRT